MYIYFFFLAHLDWNRHRRVHFFSVRLTINNFSIPVECDWSGGRCFVDVSCCCHRWSIRGYVHSRTYPTPFIGFIYSTTNESLEQSWTDAAHSHGINRFDLRSEEKKKIESKQLKMKSDQKFVFFPLLFHRLDFIFHLARVYVCRIRACQSSLLRLQRRSMHAFNHSRNPLRNRMSTNNARAIERDCYAKKKCVFKIISHFVIF